MAYKRKTVDEFVIQQYTACGWEDVDAHDNRTDARAALKTYTEGQPYFPARLIVRRIPKGES